MENSKDLYLNILKKSLIDFFNICGENSRLANARPLKWEPKFEIDHLPIAQRWILKQKIFCRQYFIRTLEKRGYIIGKPDKLTESERLNKRLLGRDWPAHATTMIGLKRLDSLQSNIETILREKVPGDFVETGVWRGGACIFMRGILKAYGITDRSIWLCDSFEGLPKPDPEKYPADKGNDLYSLEYLGVSMESVQENFKKYDLLDDKVHFVKGFFKDTLSGLPAKRFALLRLDGDLYESTQDSLKALYHKLSPGGFVIIDDYSLPMAKQAVHDFRDANGIDEEMIEIDLNAAYWQRKK